MGVRLLFVLACIRDAFQQSSFSGANPQLEHEVRLLREENEKSVLTPAFAFSMSQQPLNTNTHVPVCVCVCMCLCVRVCSSG